MKKYEIFDYDVWADKEGGYSVNDVIPTGIFIFTDTSKASICKKLNFDDPYKIDVYDSYDGILYIIYAGMPYCELHEID